ncbi:MAG: FtsX-like permease family protein [bacterium]|nr:FtsX-like permease family protein [bacterium]
MFKNYLLSALRNLNKTKLFSLINILGLAIGMTACLLILHYVGFERSYDTFHKDAKRIYRLRYDRTDSQGTAARFASCAPPTGARIRGKYPEVEKIARIYRYRAGVSFGDTKFLEERMYSAEAEFFEIFDFKFIEGNPATALKEPNRAFISQSTARKYFGSENPIGKTLSVDKKTDYQVVGIFEDVAHNSHLKFDIILSFKNLEMMYGNEVMSAWGHTGFFTYLRMKQGADLEAFKEKLARLVQAEWGEVLKGYEMQLELPLQPLEDIHLTSHYMQEYEINGSGDSVNFLFIIAFFTIIMAWVNYVNLSTAHSLTRAKEVALRKVVGASRQQLMTQFFVETIIINIIALLTAMGLMKFTLPYFGNITGTPSTYGIWTAPWFPVAIIGMFLVGVFLSGMYPVLVMTSFKPSRILKGLPGITGKGFNLRKALVVFQFVMALVLVTGTLSVYFQLQFMKNRDTGFDMEQVLVVKAPRVRGENFDKTFTIFKEKLLGYASVKKVCVSTEVPGRQILWDAGGIQKAGEDASKGKNYQIVGIDYDFADLFDLTFAAGRNFSREFPADKTALILNETAVAFMGFKSAEDAVGKQVSYWGNIYDVVGVLENFHQQSVKEAFEPHIFRFMPRGRGKRGVFAIKVAPGSVSETVGRINGLYEEFFPGNPFDYFFLDDYYDQQYRAEELVGKVIGLFALLALLVTCMGIFGLSSFMALQRTKEIGIRKVLGAGIPRILVLLSRDFMVLLGISFAVALPFSLYGIDRWLGTFAVRMGLSIWLFILPIIAVVAITLLTVSTHVIRASLANPVDSLKYE